MVSLKCPFSLPLSKFLPRCAQVHETCQLPATGSLWVCPRCVQMLLFCRGHSASILHASIWRFVAVLLFALLDVRNFEFSFSWSSFVQTVASTSHFHRSLLYRVIQ